MFALSAFIFPACGGTDTPPEGETPPQDETPPADDGLTVKIGTYDAGKGTVTLSAPANGTAYEARESVTVTAEPKEGFNVAAILVGGEVVSRLSSSYTFLYAEPVTVSAVFAPSYDAPDVNFSSPSVKSFGSLFQGYWASEKGELFIGATQLVYNGTAVTEARPRNSGSEQSYNFTIDEAEYSLSWARTDYSVGFVIDVLNLSDGSREDFFPDPLPTENLHIAEKYAGEWTSADEAGTFTLNIGDSLVYQGETVKKVLDGGYYETTNDMLTTPIGTNIYFFLFGGTMHILMWNGDTECPVVDDHIFSGADVGESYTFAEPFRGTWKSGAEEIVISENTFTLGGKTVSVNGSDDAFFFTSDGKQYEARLYAGSSYILQISSEVYGSDGLLAGYTYEYYFKENRPAVTLDTALEGTWTGENSTLIVQNGTIDWNGDALSVIEAGEARADGSVYFVALKGNVYELSLLDTAYTADAHTPMWELTLSGTDGTFIFTK